MVATIEGGKVTLYSRNGKIISDSYKEVAKALEKVKGDAVIDGELVALDAERRLAFPAAAERAAGTRQGCVYCVFDLMFAGGEDLRGLPLLERKKRLKSILPKHQAARIQRAPQGARHRILRGSGESAASKASWPSAPTAPISPVRAPTTGSRSRPPKRQEVVIAGFTAPRGDHGRIFGALVLALRDGKQWRYIGHVGTGFSHATLERASRQALAAANASVTVRNAK